MELSFDEKADAFYLRFQKGKIKKTIEINKGTLMDIDAKGQLLGIEILDVSAKMPIKDLGKISINLPIAFQ
ncbi:MAG: hypothetical protein CEN89_748 [Candidatus Berkelbacteria bacterium Licking1014_7]|uniref:DUF2283 domain-containing protein n=1 Tax=Candidatus Berkelbacteria bacterium Licking1014_7 TaxID=2017147 RepID=A0A554LHJ8_9BACT|nr:MAG: hypothetical protein CEN89_748 [Candidatus Berkelbacteria bacterium Licking1014_7]